MNSPAGKRQRNRPLRAPSSSIRNSSFCDEPISRARRGPIQAQIINLLRGIQRKSARLSLSVFISHNLSVVRHVGRTAWR